MNLTDKQLSRLRDEYASAVVEHMTHRQALSYLRQVIYNDISVVPAEDLLAKIKKTFGESVCDEMLAEITTDQVGSTANI